MLRMYCIDTEALVFMFNGGSPYGFTIHPINGLDGLKVPLLVYTNHINNKKHVHHGFLAPRPYLCSTSLKFYNIQSICKILIRTISIRGPSTFSTFSISRSSCDSVFILSFNSVSACAIWGRKA